MWQDCAPSARHALIAEAPAPCGSARWDAFLAAYAEYLAYHDGLTAPRWCHAPSRYLDVIWFPLTAELATLRTEALVHAPAHFDAHGIMIARRELGVV